VHGGSWPSAQLICYSAVIHACMKFGDADRAAQTIERMLATGMKPTKISYSTIICQLVKLGDIATAEAWLHRMIAAGTEADIVMYNT